MPRGPSRAVLEQLGKAVVCLVLHKNLCLLLGVGEQPLPPGSVGKGLLEKMSCRGSEQGSPWEQLDPAVALRELDTKSTFVLSDGEVWQEPSASAPPS